MMVVRRKVNLHQTGHCQEERGERGPPPEVLEKWQGSDENQKQKQCPKRINRTSW